MTFVEYSPLFERMSCDANPSGVPVEDVENVSVYDFDRWWQTSYWKVWISDELRHDPFSETRWCRAGPEWIYMEMPLRHLEWTLTTFSVVARRASSLWWRHLRVNEKFLMKKKNNVTFLLLSPVFLSRTFQWFSFIRCIRHTCRTLACHLAKMWTSAVSAGHYSWKWTWAALSAVIEKQQSIAYKSVVINSSMTGGGCSESCDISLMPSCHFLF